MLELEIKRGRETIYVTLKAPNEKPVVRELSIQEALNLALVLQTAAHSSTFNLSLKLG